MAGARCAASLPEMDPVEPIVGATEPQDWFIVFHRSASSWWLETLAWGRYKHVSAFAYVTGFDAWIFLDAEWKGLRIVFSRHETARRQIAKYSELCDIVKFRRTGETMALNSRLGFHCVTTIKHLLGIRARGTLQPTGLYRYLIANGGERFNDAESAGRSNAQRGADAGAE